MSDHYHRSVRRNPTSDWEREKKEGETGSHFRFFPHWENPWFSASPVTVHWSLDD